MTFKISNAEIPNAVAGQIFLFLDVRDLKNCLMVDKQWNSSITGIIKQELEKTLPKIPEDKAILQLYHEINYSSDVLVRRIAQFIKSIPVGKNGKIECASKSTKFAIEIRSWQIPSATTEGFDLQEKLWIGTSIDGSMDEEKLKYSFTAHRDVFHVPASQTEFYSTACFLEGCPDNQVWGRILKEKPFTKQNLLDEIKGVVVAKLLKWRHPDISNPLDAL